MKKYLYQICFAVGVAAFMSACQYEWNVEPVIPPPEPGDTISFSRKVAPIFDDRGCTGCHNTGGQKPDLTPANAYESIIKNGLVDLNMPADSKIYVYPHPDGKHYAKYTTNQAAIVLAWIEQGALNN